MFCCPPFYKFFTFNVCCGNVRTFSCKAYFLFSMTIVLCCYIFLSLLIDVHVDEMSIAFAWLCTYMLWKYTVLFLLVSFVFFWVLAFPQWKKVWSEQVAVRQENDWLFIYKTIGEMCFLMSVIGCARSCTWMERLKRGWKYYLVSSFFFFFLSLSFSKITVTGSVFWEVILAIQEVRVIQNTLLHFLHLLFKRSQTYLISGRFTALSNEKG